MMGEVLLVIFLLLYIGNCCVIKPSEFAVAFSNLMAELIPKYLDQVNLLFSGRCNDHGGRLNIY